MIKKITICFGVLLLNVHFLCAQTLPKPDHIVIVFEENHAYEQIIGFTPAPYINILANDTDGALFTQYYALTHPSQPNYLMLYSGSTQGVNADDITTTQFTTCNLGASLIANGYSFAGYSEDEPSIGYLGTAIANYVRRHNPWSNWQGSSANAVPDSSNLPYTYFPADYDSLPTVSFVIPNLQDDMHDGTITGGDTWLQNNLTNYITWAKTHNSLFILTFDEDDNNHNNHIATIFVGQMVKGGYYSDTTYNYNVLRTIEDMYGLPDCANSDSTNAITNVWKTNLTGINHLKADNGQIKVYPNPSNGEITITSDKNINKLKITNLLGQVIYEAQPKQTQFNLKMKDAGMYFVTVTSDDSNETKQIIVSR